MSEPATLSRAFSGGQRPDDISGCRLAIETGPTKSPLFRRAETRYSALAMSEAYHCSVCDQEEVKCQCDKYCCLCHGGNQVRLCNDGLWYCLDCREACDLMAQN